MMRNERRTTERAGQRDQPLDHRGHRGSQKEHLLNLDHAFGGISSDFVHPGDDLAGEIVSDLA